MPFPDLVWALLGIVGGYLLIDKASLTLKGKIGVWLIFIGFMFQIYWEITHPWVDDHNTSLWEVGYVSVMLLLGIGLFICAMRRKRKIATK